MRICIPSTGERGLQESVYDHFGSAPFYTIYDTETKEVRVIDNRNDHRIHGQCQGLAQLASYKINAILTSGMGPNAVNRSNSMGIKVYLLSGHTVEEAIKNFEEGKSIELTIDMACSGHAGHHHEHHHGH